MKKQIWFLFALVPILLFCHPLPLSSFFQTHFTYNPLLYGVMWLLIWFGVGSIISGIKLPPKKLFLLSNAQLMIPMVIYQIGRLSGSLLRLLWIEVGLGPVYPVMTALIMNHDWLKLLQTFPYHFSDPGNSAYIIIITIFNLGTLSGYAVNHFMAARLIIQEKSNGVN